LSEHLDFFMVHGHPNWVALNAKRGVWHP